MYIYICIYTYIQTIVEFSKCKCNVTPLQARLWPTGGLRYSSTLPRPRR